MPISRFHGKITGKFVDSGLIARFICNKGKLNQRVAGQFPCAGETGIYSSEPGMDSA
jgi:hypothetical protein